MSQCISSNFNQLLNGFDHVFLSDCIVWSSVEKFKSMNPISKVNAFQGMLPLLNLYDLVRKEWSKLPVNQSDNKRMYTQLLLLLLLFFSSYLNHVFELFWCKMATTLSCIGNNYAKTWKQYKTYNYAFSVLAKLQIEQSIKLNKRQGIKLAIW